MTLRTKTFDAFRNIIRLVHVDEVLRTFTYNKTYNSFISKFVPNNYQYPPNTIRNIDYNGIHFEVDIHDYCGHYLYYHFRDDSQTALFSLCRPGNTIIDIGTNVGFSLLNMAKISGANGFVFGFEPDPLNFNQLKKNISLNDFNNIKVTHCGLGDKAGKFLMEDRIEYNNGGKRIVPSQETSTGKFTEVQVDTLDNFMAANASHVIKVDLIKIDVEGFEMNVLKGAMATIRKFNPLLYIELDDNNLKEQMSGAREVIDFLSEAGYEITKAEHKTPVYVKDDFRNCHYDIICRKK